jgi:hypothetical protein
MWVMWGGGRGNGNFTHCSSACCCLEQAWKLLASQQPPPMLFWPYFRWQSPTEALPTSTPPPRWYNGYLVEQKTLQCPRVQESCRQQHCIPFQRTVTSSSLYPLLSSHRTGEMNLQTNHKKWKPKPLEKFHVYAANTAVVFCCQVCVYQSQKCFNPILWRQCSTQS